MKYLAYIENKLSYEEVKLKLRNATLGKNITINNDVLKYIQIDPLRKDLLFI